MSRLFVVAVPCFLFVTLCGARHIAADEAIHATRSIGFATDVYPILQGACFECHGPRKQEGGLRLDLRSEALQSGSLVSGDPDASELLRRISLPGSHDEVMPAIGTPLSKRQVRTIRRWIEQGAHWPEDFQEPPHWAYIAPQRPALPDVADRDWSKSPIDDFVLSRLEEEGLSPAPPAAPEKLARRLFLDLIGLPPTPTEVEAFAAKPTPEQLERLVDELLDRPQFGERWARPWLDLARYADSHGFQRDDLRDNWAYRDWVIQALNADMPFDQFTIEQIAGDLLPEATESQKIATGFHRCAPTNVEAGSLPEETRVEQVVDRVNTTGAIWLGTTLECCQCHNHKYDPFSIQDYYRLLAFYNSTQLEAERTDPTKPSSIQFQGPSMPLVDSERDRKREELQSELAMVEAKQAARSQELERTLQTWASGLAADRTHRSTSQVLDIVHFESQGTTDAFERLADGSVLLVGGDPPETDVYTVHVQGKIEKILALRLDVLQNDALPGKGPGRGDPDRRNFVLNEVTIALRERKSAAASDTFSSRELKIASAKASFSQKNWDVLGAIDASDKTGWAISPKFSQPHWAVFELSEPIDLAENCELVFTLTQTFGQSRTIGCFRLSAITGSLDTDSVPKEILKLASMPAEQWSNSDKKQLLARLTAQDELSDALNRQAVSLEKQISEIAPDTTLVMVELAEPRTSTVFLRGDYRMPGEPVSPGTPAILHAMPEGPANRLTLARWLASAENPLVARATVNRWWAELFGQGIVTTVEDFGVKGDPPTHPELLDWLAVEFVENGWSIKKLLKTIVLSATYQQSSRVTPELLARDDLNRWLARGPRLRMDAEMIRDNALSISGLLSLKQFGPPIRPFQPDGVWSKVGGQAYTYEVSPGSEQYRRGIYVVLKRGAPYPSFINFDATARLACTVKRSRTNTPLQALTLLNDPVYVAAAKALADRVLIEQSSAPLETKLAYAFQLCVARKPTATERKTLLRLYADQLTLSRPAKAATEKEAAAAQGSAEQIAWFNVASTLLNLHETITKD